MKRAIYPGSFDPVTNGRFNGDGMQALSGQWSAVQKILVGVLTVAVCANQPLEGSQRQVSQAGLSLRYASAYFEEPHITIEPKTVADSTPRPFQFFIPPSGQRVVSLKSKRSRMIHGNGYYYPSYNVIFVTPLQESTIDEFAKKDLSENTKVLDDLLSAPPINLSEWSEARAKEQPTAGRWVPDYPYRNAAPFLLAKFKVVSTTWGRGCRYLTYYRNGRAGYGAVNDELFYNFQGITKDRAFYISARLAITHPSLPETMDDPVAAMNETDDEFRAEHDRVDRWTDKSFFPPLAILDAMLMSIEMTK